MPSDRPDHAPRHPDRSGLLRALESAARLHPMSLFYRPWPTRPRHDDDRRR